MEVNTKVWIDDAELSVEDVVKLKEAESQGFKWTLFCLKLPDGERRLIEKAASFQHLYAFHRGPPEVESWDYDKSNIRATPKVRPNRSNITYRTGASADGRQFLQFGDETWIHISGLIEYGKDNEWLASAKCPADGLRRYTVKEDSSNPKTGWMLLSGLTLWGLTDLVLGGIGFIWAFCTLGILGVLISSCKHASEPRLIFSAAYAVWFFIIGDVQGLIAHKSPHLIEVALALTLIAVFVALARLTQRVFFVVGDGSIRASAVALCIYTFGLLAVSIGDEDLGWFSWWAYYFNQPPYIFIWWAFWAIGLYWTWEDYKKVPLTIRAFNRLRAQIVKGLRTENAIGRARNIGEQVDDLADAIHLSDDPGIRQLSGHRNILYEVARVFHALDDIELSESSVASEVAAGLSGDLEVLALDLEGLKSDSEAVRLSPMLRVAVKYKQDADDD